MRKAHRWRSSAGLVAQLAALIQNQRANAILSMPNSCDPRLQLMRCKEHRCFHRPVTTPIDVYHAFMCHWWKLQQSEPGLAGKLSHLGLERNVFDGTILATWFLSELEGRLPWLARQDFSLTHIPVQLRCMLLRLALGPLLPCLHRA